MAHEVERWRADFLQRVINATGVLLHTHLGRAPVAVNHLAHYVNLELDLTTGGRGSRSDHAGPLLAEACGAEAGLVVNNGASAVFLALAALAPGRPVVISRGELVEIGGGFRIPEIMALSGARMIEVGTTNKTHLGDYTSAVAAHPETSLLLKVHASNYRIEGFTSTVDIANLVDVGPEVMVDLGSGLLDASCPWLPGRQPKWLVGEPAVKQSLMAGAGLVTFSGDKLLGGPQAGIIVGSAESITTCARHPFYRVVRPGSLVLAALEEVALTYLHGRAAELPFWRMATTPVSTLRDRAEAIVRSVPSGVARSGPCTSAAGGGSLPGVEIPSWGVHLDGDQTAALRSAPSPIIAVSRRATTSLDLRTVDPCSDIELIAAIAALVPRPNGARPES